VITPDQSGKPAIGRVRLGKMKITREQLKQIIKEELEEAMKKSPFDGGYGFRGDYARDLPPESGGPPSSMTDPDFREDSKRRFEMYQKLRRILHNMEKEKNETTA